jgi:tetratricopeptide (TPR) repeat protein
MIKHQIYFDTLGSMKEDSASWRSVFAGLSVLRLVDAYADSATPANWAEVHGVRSAIGEVSEGDPVRGVLTGVVDELTSQGSVTDAVCVALLSYGRALDYEASWGMATDVFMTVAKLVRPEKNARLSVEANVAVGGAARRNGDWEVSARAYSQAAYIADTLGDKPGVLTVQVGIANTYLAKGNLPQAQSILDDVLVQAQDQGLPEVQAIALHSRSAVSQRRGEKTEAVRLAYEALNLTSLPSERDRVLEDLAAGFSELGMHGAARDAHLLLTATAQNKWVRWQATINLLELSSLDGMTDAFEAYASELRKAPLGPWLKSYFLVFYGEGLARFGRDEAAMEVLTEAIAYSSANEIHPASFRAEEALVATRSRKHRVTRAPSFESIPSEVLAAAHAVAELRKGATASV